MRNLQLTLQDKLCIEFDRFLKIVNQPAQSATRPTPGSTAFEPVKLSDVAIKNTQGLMRINHTGEVCAQALYYGQAIFARDETTRQHLLFAASEEHDHLYWCQQRLDELNTFTSVLNPLWYASSFVLGAGAALMGDKISYGFVIEVEKQVESHLQQHINQIPKSDDKTHAILAQMQADEIRHGENARTAGGVDLPVPIKIIMAKMANFMKFLAYRF